MQITRIFLLSIFTTIPCLGYLFYNPAESHQTTFSIMIDPAGDSKHTGRILDDNFERGITLQYAEKLKTALEERYPTIRVVLTRFPGETLQPLQNANFANRLGVNCYISIHFYHEHATKPKLYMYQFSYGDDFVQSRQDLMFYPYDKAYLINNATTNQWANLIKQSLEQEIYKKQFEVCGIYKVPFKPLIGIKAPALAFEIGLKSKNDWPQYVDAVAESLRPIIA
ncbi:MAG TPA: N-acetylmuramoyl-L-alanine amidase [Candidatus Babeliales bacterium]|nr:N-acetylmuramoyl-L-alanine amidase [Candidatus Babeliales bacterium]